MSKSIPDEVLRRLADTHIVRYLPDPGEEDDGVLLGRTMLKHLDDCVTGGFYFEVCDEAAAGLRCDLRDLARELLALREALAKARNDLSWIEVSARLAGDGRCNMERLLEVMREIQAYSFGFMNSIDLTLGRVQLPDTGRP